VRRVNKQVKFGQVK